MSRQRYRFSPQAKRDLQGIASYISKDSPRAAKAVTSKLREACKSTIGMFPECGTMRDDLKPGMRCFSVGNYVIFFRGKNPVEILRIVHGAQDFPALDFPV